MISPRETTHDATLKRFQDALLAADTIRYELTLFVSGASDLSARAIANARRLCDAHLPGRYELTVVNLHDHPSGPVDARVLASPTLVRYRPLPVRMIVGDLTQTARVLQALELPDATAPQPRG